MNMRRLKELCDRGEKAEELLQGGHTREALKALTEIAEDLEKHGDFDSFIAAKVTLALLRCHVKLGNFKAAYEIWNSNLEDSLYGLGIYSLESAQTTLRDMIAYDMICAFLHTIGDSDKKTAAAAVNQYMSRVCEQAFEDGDRAVMRTALNNWKQHLRQIFGASIPHRIAEPLIMHERSFGESVPMEPFEFPAGSGWQRPNDFLEISRIADIRSRRQLEAEEKAKKRAG